MASCKPCVTLVGAARPNLGGADEEKTAMFGGGSESGRYWGNGPLQLGALKVHVAKSSRELSIICDSTTLEKPELLDTEWGSKDTIRVFNIYTLLVEYTS